MPVHNWRLVEAGIFHDFHNLWLAEIRTTLNSGLLPPDYYALIEQHAGQVLSDVLTRHPVPSGGNGQHSAGGVAVAVAPPRVARHLNLPLQRKRRGRQPRTLAIRHVTGHVIVALLEIVSPANKDRSRQRTRFAQKVASALRAGVHVVLVDLFRPGPHDPQGMHGAVCEWYDDREPLYDLPPHQPLTLACYMAKPQPSV